MLITKNLESNKLLWAIILGKPSMNHIPKNFNFYFVNNGNHSIAGGRIARKGTIICNHAIDYTSIIRTYDYDGKYFYNEKNKRLNKPFLNEFGELFILGKVLLEKTV